MKNIGQHPLYIWIIAIPSVLLGFYGVFQLVVDIQAQADSAYFISSALTIALIVLYLVGGISLIHNKTWSKYLFLAIGVISLSLVTYSVWEAAIGERSFVSQTVNNEGVPVIAYSFPMSMVDVYSIISAYLVWRYFRRGNV
jgi:hypothetical protein